jgi:nucleoside-diphosphate-sugar epimerase
LKMSKKIALTGATGFAGGPILQALLRDGHDVSALVRNPRHQQFSAAVVVVQGDLENDSALSDLVHHADVVVHVAGAISGDYARVNVDGTKRIFTAAHVSGVKRFIYVSSITARQPEISTYAASKRAAEEFLQNAKTDMEIVILRPSAIYGPGDKSTLPLLAAMQKRVALLPGRSDAKFSLVHVDDFARVVASAACSTAKGLFEVDDMSGGHGWAELAAICAKLTGMPQHLTYLPKGLVSLVALGAEIGAYFTGQTGLVNRGKVRELYHHDWVARGANWQRENPIGLNEGLTETLKWYQREGWLPETKRSVKSAA